METENITMTSVTIVRLKIKISLLTKLLFLSPIAIAAVAIPKLTQMTSRRTAIHLIIAL